MKNETIDEKIKELREFYVEMHPMHGHDLHNPPLLYDKKSEDVNELFGSIRQILQETARSIRLETIEEMKQKIENLKTEIPEFESDDYDDGRRDMKKEVLEIIK